MSSRYFSPTKRYRKRKKFGEKNGAFGNRAALFSCFLRQICRAAIHRAEKSVTFAASNFQGIIIF